MASFRHGGLHREILRAEFAQLFAGKCNEEDGAFGPRAGCENFGGLDHRSHAGGVIHRPVVDAVAVDRPADTEMVKMGADDDEFLLQLAVAAFQFADDVG